MKKISLFWAFVAFCETLHLPELVGVVLQVHKPQVVLICLATFLAKTLNVLHEAGFIKNGKFIPIFNILANALLSLIGLGLFTSHGINIQENLWQNLIMFFVFFSAISIIDYSIKVLAFIALNQEAKLLEGDEDVVNLWKWIKGVLFVTIYAIFSFLSIAF